MYYSTHVQNSMDVVHWGGRPLLLVPGHGHCMSTAMRINQSVKDHQLLTSTRNRYVKTIQKYPKPSYYHYIILYTYIYIYIRCIPIQKNPNIYRYCFLAFPRTCSDVTLADLPTATIGYCRGT